MEGNKGVVLRGSGDESPVLGALPFTRRVAWACLHPLSSQFPHLYHGELDSTGSSISCCLIHIPGDDLDLRQKVLPSVWLTSFSSSFSLPILPSLTLPLVLPLYPPAQKEWGSHCSHLGSPLPSQAALTGPEPEMGPSFLNCRFWVPKSVLKLLHPRAVLEAVVAFCSFVSKGFVTLSVMGSMLSVGM